MKDFDVAPFILLLAGLLFIPPSYATDMQTATYDVRPAGGSRFALEVFKSKLWEGRKHTYVFDRLSGSLNFNHEQPERSPVEFAVESASARCIDDWVKPNQIKDIEKAAIQGTIAAAQFPKITFRSTTITTKSSGQYEVRGLLTIRDQTRSVVLIIKVTPREGGIWVEGSGQIRLSDFGLWPPRAAPGVCLFIGPKDEMPVHFALLANQL